MVSVIGAIAQAIGGRFQPTVPTSLFFRQDGYSVGEVSMDLILSEDHLKEANVAKHPVQDGNVISDHIVVLPRSGTLTCLVSNFSLAAAEDNSKKVAQQVYSDAEQAFKAGGLPNRAAEAWDALKAVMDKKELVTIVTVLEVYENMAITSLATTRDEETGDALEIRIGYEQVNKVKLREDRVVATVSPRDMKSTINKKSAVQVNSGQKVGTEATAQEEAELTLGEVEVNP